MAIPGTELQHCHENKLWQQKSQEWGESEALCVCMFRVGVELHQCRHWIAFISCEPIVSEIQLILCKSGFHLATKIWDGSEINEWAYSARQLPGCIFLGEFL